MCFTAHFTYIQKKKKESFLVFHLKTTLYLVTQTLAKMPLFKNYPPIDSCIAAAAWRPSPIAKITVAPPRTISPPA